MKKFITLFSVLALFSLAACGGGGGSSESSSCGVLNARIFGGETCNPETRSPVVTIVPLAFNGTDVVEAGICTGGMVTLDDLVTSAHCFVDPIKDLGDLIVGFGVKFSGGSQNEERFVISNASLHPLYNGQAGSPFDIAIATLERVPNPPVGPLPLAASVATLPGDEGTTFGYGTNNKGEVGELKASDIKIEAIAEGNIWSTLQTSGASICQGDSGGPLVKYLDGVVTLVGVNSVGFTTAEQCAASGNELFGFVDIQNPTIGEFLLNYAPDIALR